MTRSVGTLASASRQRRCIATLCCRSDGDCSSTEHEHGPLVFHALPTPTHAEVADIAARTAERIEQLLHAKPTMNQQELVSLAQPGTNSEPL